MKSTHIALARLVVSLGAILLALMAYIQPAHAASVLPLYLEEVIDNSSVAFEGTCVENRTERDPATGLVVTHTKFAVHDVLKGTVGTTHSIKQIGGSLPGENIQYRVEGVPKFTVGEDYVVFLAGVSASGFSSPIGLEQGNFGVKSSAAGRRVSNGRDLKEMASRMSAQLPPTAQSRLKQAGAVQDMDLDDFKKTVRNRVAAAK